MGGIFMRPFTPKTRRAAQASAGDTIDLEIELDTARRDVTLPADLAAALAGDRVARRRFDELSYTNKRGPVSPVGAANGEAMRLRRVEKAIEALRDGA